MKDIYEAVRSGPGWSKTLLAIVYDECDGANAGSLLLSPPPNSMPVVVIWSMLCCYHSAGGLYDHVVPPFGIPSDESPCNVGNIPPHSNTSIWDSPLRAPNTPHPRHGLDAHRLLTAKERELAGMRTHVVCE